jgi:hypothetical protein
MVGSIYKEKNSITRLSQNHKKLVDSMWERIMSIEPIDRWIGGVVANYVESPLSFDYSGTQYNKICELMEDHELDLTAATILFHGMGE